MEKPVQAGGPPTPTHEPNQQAAEITKAESARWIRVQFRVVGGKATKGIFRYSAPGPCRATELFTAKRTGR